MDLGSALLAPWGQPSSSHHTWPDIGWISGPQVSRAGTPRPPCAISGVARVKSSRQGASLLQESITSRHITSFISYMRMVYSPMSTLAGRHG